MERCPAGGKEQHHGGHHSYRTLLPPENERHLYCYRHVNNSTIQVCQSNTISFVLVYQDHVIREQQCRRYAIPAIKAAAKLYGQTKKFLLLLFIVKILRILITQLSMLRYQPRGLQPFSGSLVNRDGARTPCYILYKTESCILSLVYNIVQY